jgi:hypothetical protein
MILEKKIFFQIEKLVYMEKLFSTSEIQINTYILLSHEWWIPHVREGLYINL